MSGFEIECGCGARFTSPLPRVLCDDCRVAFADALMEAQARFYLEHPEYPMPGDRVRRRTEDDKAFERAVMADVAAL